jgi:pilus assembly protein CpaB
MKPKTLILLVVAVGCGLGASIMTSRLLADRQRQSEPEPMVRVLVAKGRVPGFLPLKEPEKLFDIVEMPAKFAPKRHYAGEGDKLDAAQLKDQKLNKTLGEGHILLTDDIQSKDQRSIVDMLQPGQRAVAITVNAASTVAGFVHPGSRVDVVSTVRGQESSSQLILQNMLVVAVDDNDTRNPDKKVILGQTVTLAATPEEAGRLTLAQAMGELRLLLKAEGDTSRVSQFTIKPADLRKAPSDSSRLPPPSTVVGGPSSPPPVLPLDPLPPDEKKGPSEVVKVDKKPDPPRELPRRKLHVMRIVTGASTEKVMFDLNRSRDEEDDDAQGGSPARKPDDARKPAPPTPGGAGKAREPGKPAGGRPGPAVGGK